LHFLLTKKFGLSIPD